MKTFKESKTVSNILNSIITKLPLIYGFAILAALSFLLYVFIKTILATLTPTTVALLVVMLTGLSAFVVSIISKHYEQKILTANKLREKKIPVYEDLINFIFKMTMYKSIGGKPPTEEEIKIFMSNFTQKIIIWGADEVLLAYYKFRYVGLHSPNKPHPSILFCVEDLLLAIRKDLGHKNKGLDRGKLLGLFVNDIEEFMAKNTG